MAVAFAPEAFAVEAFESELPVGWYDLGAIPEVAAANNADGRIVQKLKLFNGRIYIGYGEFNGNPGDCDIIAWDDSSGVENIGAFTSIATHALKDVGSELWILSGQGTGTDDIAVVSSTHTLSKISSSDIVYYHLFDAIQYGSDQYVAGARQESGVSNGGVWKRSSGTWSTSYDSNDATTAGYRCYGLFELGGELFVSRNDGTLRKTTGSTWSTPSGGPDLGYRPSHFLNVSGGVIYRSGDGTNAYIHSKTVGGDPVDLRRWTGSGSDSSVESACIDACLDESGVPWVLRKVSSTLEIAYGNASGTSWTQEDDTIPQNASSLAVTDEAFWIGTEDSHLWRYYR